MVNRKNYIEDILILKEKAIDVDASIFDISFIKKEMIEDLENMEDLVRRIDEKSNWEVIDNKFDELKSSLNILETIIDGNLEKDIIIFKTPLNISSNTIYQLIYNTNLEIQKLGKPSISSYLRI